MQKLITILLIRFDLPALYSFRYEILIWNMEFQRRILENSIIIVCGIFKYAGIWDVSEGSRVDDEAVGDGFAITTDRIRSSKRINLQKSSRRHIIGRSG